MKKILALLICVFMLAGCQPRIPKDALVLSPESLEDRQLQTRRFETTDKATMLGAAAAVLQGLGFNLEESEMPLGVLVGSKQRDATSGAQVAGALLIALLGGGAIPVDSQQTIRVAMVMREKEDPEKAQKAPLQTLTADEIGNIKTAMEKGISAGLIRHYPQEISQKVAAQMAENTAKTLTDDLGRLLAVHAAPGESIVRVTFQRVIKNTVGQVTRAEQIKDVEIYRDFYEKLSKSVFLEAHEL